MTRTLLNMTIFQSDNPVFKRIFNQLYQTGVVVAICAHKLLNGNTRTRQYIHWQSTTDDEVFYELISTPFDVEFIWNGWKKWDILPVWFRTLTPLEMISNWNKRRVYHATFQKNKFRLMSKNSDWKFDMTKNNDDIGEARLYGTEASLFERHFPCGIIITEFAKLVCQSYAETQTIGKDEQKIHLYEILPLILYKVSVELDLPSHHYEKDTMYVTLLMEESCDMYTIYPNDVVLPFSLTNYRCE